MTDKPPHLLTTRLARRPALMMGAALMVAAAIGLMPGAASAQGAKADAADLTAELMKPGTIPDLALGKEDAPVTIIEYASMTCSHCATFHNAILPQLKAKYIDTGKVRLILREFPLDNLAAAGSMLARCAGGEKTYEVISTLFAKQSEWAFVQGNPVPALFKIVGDHGFTKESFDQCLTDQKLLDGITGVRDRANKSLGVRSTPTFFINGRKMADRSDQIEAFDRAIEPLLKK